jgi:hypothetical protein
LTWKNPTLESQWFSSSISHVMWVVQNLTAISILSVVQIIRRVVWHHIAFDLGAHVWILSAGYLLFGGLRTRPRTSRQAGLWHTAQNVFDLIFFVVCLVDVIQVKNVADNLEDLVNKQWIIWITFRIFFMVNKLENRKKSSYFLLNSYKIEKNCLKKIWFFFKLSK